MALSDYLMTVRAQTWLFLGSCVLGLGLGLLLDCFRLLRVLLPHPAAAVLMEDALYAAGCVLLVQCYAVSFGNGRTELWMILGAVLGLALYLVTAGAAFTAAARRSRDFFVKTAKKLRKSKKTSPETLDPSGEMRYNRE